MEREREREQQSTREGGLYGPAFVELFFDLVYVFALTKLTDELVGDLTWAGAFRMIVLLLAVWWAWSATAWVVARFDPSRGSVQLLIVAAMLGSLLLTAALPKAYGDRDLVFASAYVGVHILRGLYLLLIVRGREARRRVARILFWYLVSAVPWIGGTFAEDPLRGALWIVAVAIDYSADMLQYPAPGLGRGQVSEWTVAGEHLTTRYFQFLAIAFGELILVAGAALDSGEFTAERTLAFVLSFVGAVLLWLVYFHRGGALMGDAIRSAADPVRVGRSASYAHLLMLAGVVVTAVGDHLVIDHPFGATTAPKVAAIVSGPALFLAARSLFEYRVLGRVDWSRLVGCGVLVLLGPPMIFLSPLLIVCTVNAVLLGVVLADLKMLIRHRSARQNRRSAAK
ncbi:low temperature requirement protein A [Plantactinospora endophytica]|uniref:Membrane protein n=1 Tax=Plantactinospora endophytica TaxID=673535 RepID=A0ABQ4E838_9ACTN|nr:low temperature requirement protein A [Plantactinospora endophytica]GIG90877.1 membrane protein [Plantactinospora endophytica]